MATTIIVVDVCLSLAACDFLSAVTRLRHRRHSSSLVLPVPYPPYPAAQLRDGPVGNVQGTIRALKSTDRPTPDKGTSQYFIVRKCVITHCIAYYCRHGLTHFY